MNTFDITERLNAQRPVGVPYTDEQIANASADLRAQADPTADSSGAAGTLSESRRRCRAAASRTEMDALVAYLQMMGTLVNFADTTTERLRQ